MIILTGFGALPSVFLSYKVKCMWDHARRAEEKAADAASAAERAEADASIRVASTKSYFVEMKKQAAAVSTGVAKRARLEAQAAQSIDEVWRGRFDDSGKCIERGKLRRNWIITGAILVIRPLDQLCR